MKLYLRDLLWAFVVCGLVIALLDARYSLAEAARENDLLKRQNERILGSVPKLLFPDFCGGMRIRRELSSHFGGQGWRVIV
jgi:hypothetical protein